MSLVGLVARQFLQLGLHLREFKLDFFFSVLSFLFETVIALLELSKLVTGFLGLPLSLDQFQLQL